MTWQEVWDDLYGAVAAVWPEIATVIRAVTAEHINWVTVIEAGGITVPYVVIHLPPPLETVEWGMANTVYEATPTFFYIANSEAEANLEIKMKAMQDYVSAQETRPFQALQFLPGGLMTDVSEINPITTSMLEAAMPFTVGSLSFRCIFGETA